VSASQEGEHTSCPRPPNLCRRRGASADADAKFSRWVTTAAGIILGLIGLLKIYNYMVPQMPACADSNTADVIRDIFKKKTSR